MRDPLSGPLAAGGARLARTVIYFMPSQFINTTGANSFANEDGGQEQVFAQCPFG